MDTFETSKRSFISAFLICITVHLIENNVRNIFFENHARLEGGKLVPDIFFNKALYEVKEEACPLFSIYFNCLQLEHKIKQTV